ncbi:hypothetical protein OLMES_1658 [Oleiphilus messinensis]|uniref:Formyl transferase N-terminal domain-containing protein n=1 Tax=Oleiphilus messinensis TaxID=141451 RepID=A0A1Y0I8K7_9GAMM|nr:formyltransferase family protein [Oleiphilus messinensis]ARU55733.1 hypothetical protein OLMES_1658 [Oleiphilus messinensis]
MTSNKEPTKFKAVFLSGSVFSSMASSVAEKLQDIDHLELYMVAQKITLNRIKEVGFNALLSRLRQLKNSKNKTIAEANHSPQIPQVSPTKPIIKKFTVKKIGDGKSKQILDAINPDVCINTGGCGILLPDFIGHTGLGVLNIHSGLPYVRGYNVMEWQAYYGMELNLSVHLIDGGIDTGPILKTIDLPRLEKPTIQDIRSGSIKHQIDLLADGIKLLAQNKNHEFQPQSAHVGKQHFAMHNNLSSLLDSHLIAKGYNAKISDYPNPKKCHKDTFIQHWGEDNKIL